MHFELLQTRACHNYNRKIYKFIDENSKAQQSAAYTYDSYVHNTYEYTHILWQQNQCDMNKGNESRERT